MKLKYGVILSALVAGVFFGSAQRAAAQQGDTLTVEWYDPSAGGGAGDVIRDALVNAINNDTNRPAGRVYLLKRGGYYWNRETIQNTGYHLRIVGQPAGQTAEENPPVLQMVSRDDGSINQRMITGVSSITLKNLWITGADDIGRQTAYQPIQIDANDSRIVVDNCIIDRSNFALIAFTGKNNDLFFTNNKFRNLIGRPSTQQWEGRGISVWADQDTAIVENNTFFNLEFTVFQMEGGAISYLRFNHNTMVNVGRNFLTGSWWREAYFANNLIVNGFWHGEGPGDYNAAGRDPRSYQSGMMGIGPLPSKYGPEQGRRILLANTAAWRDPAFATYYGTTVRPQAFIGDVTRLDYLSGQYPNIVAKDTTWLNARPNFPTYPDTLLPKMWQNITDLRANVTPATPYFFDLPMIDDTTECFVCVSWPLPDNFAYTTPQLLTAGTDGLPLGDLNWFPTQKANFEANKNRYVAELQALAGERLDLTLEGSLEAEAGTLAGDAKIKPYGGATPYLHMEGGGFIRWKFNMPEAGTVDLKIVTRSQDARRGQHVRVNGVGLRNDAGFGEYSWYDLDPVQWKEYTIRQAGLIEGGAALNLQAGDNTIEIAPSWGYQEFQSVTVELNGTVITTLDATNVTELDIVQLITPVVLPWFKMEGGGYIRWTFDMAAAATAELRITTRSQDARRGQHVRVNGVGLRNDAGFGEYSWYDLDPVQWKTYTIKQADLIEGAAALNLPAGANTIEIAPSWGYQEFLRVEVLVGGQVVQDLTATNVTEYDVVTIVSPAGLPPASGFKSVLIGANGNITWKINVPATGNYRLNVFYNTPEGTQSGSVQVGGAAVAAFQYKGEAAEERWRSVLTGKFALSAGEQAITVTGSKVDVDFIQFLRDQTVTSVDEESSLRGFALYQNYPNPFNPTTNIAFSLGKPSNVKLTVYNLLGQKVVTLVDRRMDIGVHIIQFEPKKFASGVYFYRLEAGDFMSQKRMLFIK